jgi:DNA topoisomerase-1
MQATAAEGGRAAGIPGSFLARAARVNAEAVPRGAVNGEREEALAAAAEARLRYVSDEEPGIRRRRCGRGFSYRDPQGRTVREPAVRRRIDGLAIPPAWTDVWICRDARGHLQATGRDARGRKQYRYHPRWREVRDARKYESMADFGAALPRIRDRVRRDLRRRGMPREKVLAAVVRLLETTCIRVGNEEYRRQNGSFGLTTLRRRHVSVDGSTLRFSFRGKGGKRHEVQLSDPALARLVRNCQEIAGYEIFQYVDADGERHGVDSGDVNDYLREASGEDFTAKDFRTWHGTVHALERLCTLGPTHDEAAAQKNLLAAVDHVADQLCNTRQICRDFYVHPLVQRGYLEGWLFADLDPHAFPPPPRGGLTGSESVLLDLLRRRGGQCLP